LILTLILLHPVPFKFCVKYSEVYVTDSKHDFSKCTSLSQKVPRLWFDQFCWHAVLWRYPPHWVQFST